MPPHNDWWVVLADFGISKRALSNIEASSAVDGFMAPELSQLNSQDSPEHTLGSKAADLWALGEVVVQMLTGGPTFRSTQELVQYCAGEPFPFDRLSLSITANGKDFISILMAVDPQNRLTTSQCLEHPWINSQRLSLAEELSPIHTAQTNPVELAHPGNSLATSWSNVSSTNSTPARPKVARKPVNSWTSHGSSSVDAEEKQVYVRPTVDTEEKQVCQNPARESEEKQVRLSPTAEGMKEVSLNLHIESEDKEVYMTPRAEGEGKQVSQNSSITPSQRIIQESPFVAKVARQTLDGHSLAVNAIAFSPDGGILASASDDGTIKLWDGQFRSTPLTLQAHTTAVNAVAFSPDGKTLVSSAAASKGIIKLWDCGSGAQLETLRCRSFAVNTLAFSPDSETLASASLLDEGIIRLWDGKSGALRASLEGHWLNVNTVRFSPDGKTLASASHDGYVKTWDLQWGKSLKTLWGYSQWVNALALEPSGIRAASLSPAGIRDVVYSPDGTQLASASDDGTIRLWDSRSGSAIKTFKRQWRWATVSPVGINSVVFSPGGTFLVSGSDDGIIKIWDMRTGTVLQTFKAHTKWISSLAFSPEGKTLASASHDGNIRLWG
jgi:WD40 repeat protein